ncbi:TPA: hypothetical protein ACHKBA_005204, partial [Escherichia coli]
IVSLRMIKIMSDMNLCVLLNYHIACPFPAAQIRFPAFLPRRSENPESRIFLSLTQRHLLSVQHVVLHSAAHDTIYCVISLTCDASRRGGKQRYDYFPSVVHFRKVVIFRKVGSDGNGSPVI